MKNSSRTVLALVVVILVASLLGIEAPHLDSDLGNLEEYALWLNVESAVSYFFAAGIGAIVARKTFVVHALTLAAFVWLTVTHTLYRISRATGPVSFMEVASEQLIGLLLVMAAAMLGAMLGRWFYKHECESGTAAS